MLYPAELPGHPSDSSRARTWQPADVAGFVFIGYIRDMRFPRITLSLLDASEPLRKRAPTVDENGNALSDFMVIFPGLRNRSQLQIQQTMQEIQKVLGYYSQSVVFAELNLRLNLLWVSTRRVDGLRFEIAGSLRERIPSAKLVSHV